MWILVGENEIAKFDGVYRNCKCINFVTTGGTISIELKLPYQKIQKNK